MPKTQKKSYQAELFNLFELSGTDTSSRTGKNSAHSSPAETHSATNSDHREEVVNRLIQRIKTI